MGDIYIASKLEKLAGLLREGLVTTTLAFVSSGQIEQERTPKKGPN